MTRINVLKAEKVVWEPEVGDHALVLEDGVARPDRQLPRVVIAHKPVMDERTGELFVACHPPGSPRDIWEVKRSSLVPCDEQGRLLGARPDALQVSWREGAAPGDMVLHWRSRATHPALERFERVGPAEPPPPIDLGQAVLTAGQRQRLDEGTRLAAEDRPLRERRQGRKILRELHAELAAQAEAADATAYFVGAIKARGLTEADLENDGRALRMTKVDGLDSVANHLTGAQVGIAIRYRQATLAVSTGAGAQRIGDGVRTVHNNDLYVVNTLERARLTSWRAQVDRAVALRQISHPSALTMLRDVVGRGIAITAWGKGRAYERNMAALRFALDVAIAEPLNPPGRLATG